MSRIPGKPGLALADLRNKSSLSWPLADRHTVNASGYGSPRHATGDVLEWVVSYQLVDAPAHGCTAADIGKPLALDALLDDTNIAHWPTWILMGIPTPDVMLVAVPGCRVRIDKSLLESGLDPVVNRRVWWDLSDAKYKATRQPNAARGLCSQLTILSVGATTFDAIVPQFASQLRILPEKMLSANDESTKTTNILPANAALDAIVWVGGISVSYEDGVFSPSTGNLSWTGLGLEGHAVEGARVTGFWEPKL